MPVLDRFARAALVAAIAAGCADRGGGAAKPNPPTAATDATATTPTTPTDATDTQGATMSDVTITSAGERPGRPPLIRLLVDVTASNPGTATRWVLIQSKLPGAAGGVDKLEQLTAPGGVVLGRFLGTGGFYSVALAPGAKVTIKNLEIGWWNEDDAKTPPPIEVRTGTAVALGAADIATWFEGNPAVSGKVVVDADKAEHTRSKRADGDREVLVQLTGGQTAALPVK